MTAMDADPIDLCRATAANALDAGERHPQTVFVIHGMVVELSIWY
jgi:hypothetical protein